MLIFFGLLITGIVVMVAGVGLVIRWAARREAAENTDRQNQEIWEQRRRVGDETPEPPKERQITLAQGEAQATIERAKGEAEANDLINASLTDNLLTWRGIDKINPNVKVMMVPQDQGFILDIGQVVDGE